MTQPSGIARYARLLLDAPQYVQGWQEVIYLPNPAAGAGWSYTVDGRFHERLIAAKWFFTADAVVANRFPSLVLQDATGHVITSAQAAGTVVAGSSLNIYLHKDAPVQGSGTSGSSRGWLPDVLAAPGSVWFSGASGYDPGDTEQNVVLLVQRFPSDITRIDAAG